MLIAETGSNVLVTNEGNADLTHTLPRVHIVIATLEKVVPTLEDATSILRVLARSATGAAPLGRRQGVEGVVADDLAGEGPAQDPQGGATAPAP